MSDIKGVSPVLTDERIKQVARDAVAARLLSWTGFEEDERGFYTVPSLSPCHYQFARAIEREVAKAAPAAPVQTDREARQRVAKALGLQGCTDGKYSFAWEYLLDCIEECAKEADDVVSPVQPEKPLVFDDFPEFNEQAMGCGLEDRGITDRYEAMRYGFEEALDLVDERIKNFLADFAAPAVAAPVQAEQAQAEPVAYLHQVVCGDGEPDQALSFAPDNFPLAGTLGYRSLSHQPLYVAPVAALPAQAEQAEGQKGGAA